MCPATFSDKSPTEQANVISQAKQINSTNPLIHKCEFCDRHFTFRNNMYVHRKKCKHKFKATNIFDEVEEIKKANTQHNQDLCHLRTQVESLKDHIEKGSEIDRLRLEVAALKERKNEKFYQECLETFKFPGSSHCRLSCGITDITTDVLHAEIKAFDCWKEAIGQLLAYNLEAPRDELHVYLFGGRTKSGLCKQELSNMFQKLGIKAFELKSTADDFIIVHLEDGSTERFPFSQEEGDEEGPIQQ